MGYLICFSPHKLNTRVDIILFKDSFTIMDNHPKFCNILTWRWKTIHHFFGIKLKIDRSQVQLMNLFQSWWQSKSFANMYLTDWSKPFSFCQNKSACIIPYTNSYSHSIRKLWERSINIALKSSFRWFDLFHISFLWRLCTRCITKPMCILPIMKHSFCSLHNINLSINYLILQFVISLFSYTPQHTTK